MSKKMRRPRHEPPKVWHNPDVIRPRAAERGVASPVIVVPDAPPSDPKSGVRSRSGKIVARAATAPVDPLEVERERLLEKLRTAEGRPAITRAAADLERGGFALPDDDQIVHLQLLEHSDEGRVRAALARLEELLAAAPAKRFTVLESRLRRLEQLADEAETRAAARALWRRVTGRDAGTRGA
jgi:hypothetical protein